MSPMPSPSSVSTSNTVMASSGPASKNVDVSKAQERQTQRTLNDATPGYGSVKGRTVSDFGIKVASASETDIADSGNKKYQCHTCKKTFRTTSNLNHHIRDVHSTGPNETCSVCRKTFKNKQYLRSHMNNTHNDDKKKHKCDHCGIAYRYPSLLKDHLNTHTNERKFACPVCPMAYKSRSALARHKIVKHSEKKSHLICSECGDTFTLKHVLERHKNTHRLDKPYQCQTCNRKFTDKYSLHKHNRNPCQYKCSQCDRSFGCERWVLHHKCVNPGKKDYKCPDCGKCFVSKQNMKLHASKMHADLQVKKKPAKSDGHKEAIQKMLLKKQNVASDSVINQSHSVTDQPSASGT